MLHYPRSSAMRPVLAAWLGYAACLALSPSLAQAQPADWSKMPTMRLERQFGGPLKDTIIQRWRDPADGTVCVIYLPINAPHSQPQSSGYVQYGSASIGTISCFAGPAPSVAGGAPPQAAVAPAAPRAPALAAAPAKPALVQRVSTPQPPVSLDGRANPVTPAAAETPR